MGIEKLYELSECADKILQGKDNKTDLKSIIQQIKGLVSKFKQGSIGLAQLNPVVGDIEYNSKKIMKYISYATEIDLDVVVFPELSIMGYPIEDTIDRHPVIVEENIKWLKEIAHLTTTTTAPETQQTQYAPTTSGTTTTSGATTTSGTPSTTGGVIPLRKQGTESAQIPLMEPVRGKPRISSRFGPRIHPISKKRSLHKGIDLAVPTGTQIYAPADGTVVNIWYDKTCGNGLKIAHGMGYETVYCHLQSVNVTNGAKVQKNSVVALSGNTGGSTGPHLHYAIKKDGKFINPSDLIGR
jgi:murein DD-endopeptidase MepM/ murein hydrolase activator NlpD